MNAFILWFNYFVLGYYTVTSLIYVFLLIVAFFVIVKHLHRLKYAGYQEWIHPSASPPVSIIIAAYNEEKGIVETVNSLFLMDYPSFEIIVASDGSTDSTLPNLVRAFGLKRIDLIYRPIIPTSGVRGFYVNPLRPNLTVIDKEHGGKSDSMNVGINAARSPYFCSIDADSVLERDALTRLMRPIIEEPEIVKATGGIVRIVNGCAVKDGNISAVGIPKSRLARFQVIEYVRSFLFGRTGWSAINSLLILSGTFSMFNKRVVQSVGGYNTNTVTEDMELVVKVHRFLMDSDEKYKIVFVPDPICWTEVPENMKMLARQRRRWHTGLGESLYLHRSMLFNPRYGTVGLFAMPYQLLIEFFGPLVEVSGYFVIAYSFAAGLVDWQFFSLFLVVAILFGVFLSTGAILLEEMTYKRYPKIADFAKLMLYGLLENFGYRQMTVLWRAEAAIKFFFKGKKKWEVVVKKGFRKAGEGA
ncbi:MAG: glycosyltransferase [Thermodesulfobacteriota bacterium]